MAMLEPGNKKTLNRSLVDFIHFSQGSRGPVGPPGAAGKRGLVVRTLKP